MPAMRRTASTAAVVAILAVGFWLGNMFKGFGLGPGGGGGSDSSSQSPGPGTGGTRDPNQRREAIESKKELVSTPETLPEVQPAQSPEAVSPGAPSLVTVAIDGSGYALSTDGVRFQPATLGQVIEVARDTTGNDQGVRVRVVRRKNAVNGARLDLFHELEAAGLRREAIQEMTGFVD
jgi:hypothetical protein